MRILLLYPGSIEMEQELGLVLYLWILGRVRELYYQSDFALTSSYKEYLQMANGKWLKGSGSALLCLRPLVLITRKYNWADGDEVKAQYNFNKIVQPSMLCLAILV